MNYYIGIDIGTSGTKAIMFDRNGNSIKQSMYEYPIIVLQNGYAEQNPLDWFNASVNCLKDLSKDFDNKLIKGIGLSGQMHGLVLLDKDDNILHNSIIWCDNRTSNEVLEIESKINGSRIREITGSYPMLAFTLAKLLWVKNNLPEVYSKIDKIMLPKDYIRYCLTKEFKTEYSDCSGMQMLDINSREYSKEILDLFEIDINKLPKICNSWEITGYITNDISLKTGLSTNTYVVGGASDQASGAIGNGIIKEGDISITLGSSGVVFAATKEHDSKANLSYFCHACPDMYHSMAVTNGAGNSLKWYRDTLCNEEKEQAIKTNKDVYGLITKDIDKIEPGSNGLIFLPYLMGERTPYLDPFATGCFIGLRGSTTKDHMTRAIIEGVSYSMLDCFNLINDNPNKVIISGGGSKNDLWCKIIASMINQDVLRITVSDGAVLGAAILAMVGNNEYSSIDEACNNIIKVSDNINSDENWNRIYTKLYKLYQDSYRVNKELFKETEKRLKEINNEQLF